MLMVDQMACRKIETTNSIHVALLISCLLFVGSASNVDDHQNMLHELPLQDTYHLDHAAEEQLPDFNNFSLQGDKSALEEEANKDLIAIGKAYEDYEDILAKEEALLSKEKDNINEEDLEIHGEVREMNNNIASTQVAEEYINQDDMVNQELPHMLFGVNEDLNDRALKELSIDLDYEFIYSPKGCPRGSPKSHTRSSPKVDKGFPWTSPKGHPKSSPKDRPISHKGRPRSHKGHLRSHKSHPKNSPNGRPKSSPKGRPKSSPKGHPKYSPKGRPKISPKGRPKGSPNGRPKSSPRGRPKSQPKSSPKGRHKLKFRNFPKSCSKFTNKFLRIKNRGQLNFKNKLIKFVTSRARDISLQDFVSISGFNSLLIKSIRLDCSTHILTITVKAKREWVIIPDYMSLQDLSGLLTVKITSPQNTLQASLRGDWRVGNLNVLTMVKYSAASQITHIVVEPKSRTSLKSFVKSVTSLNFPISSSIKVHFKFEGSMYPRGAVFLLLSSKQSDNWLYALFKKNNKTSQAVKAIAVEVKRFRLSTLVKRLVKLDFSQTPFFGKLTVPDTGLIYSTGPMKIAGRKVFENSPLLQTTKNVISKGLSVYFRVPFHPDPLIAKYKNRVLVMTTLHQNLRLDKLLHYILSGGERSISSLPLPQWQKIFKLHIEKITVAKDSVTVQVSFPRPVVFFQKSFSLSEVKTRVHIQKKRPRISVLVTGNIHIAGTTFQAEFYRNQKRKYVLKAVGNKLEINQLIRSFHAAILPKKLSALLSRIPFLKIAIIKPKLFYTFGVRPLQIHFGGIPELHGYKIVNMDVLMVKMKGQVKSILAFKMGTINLAEVLTKITGFNFKRFFILNQQLSFTLTISPVSLPRAHFAGELASLPIKRGVSLKASMKFPRRCGSDRFCKFAGRLIGHNAALSLKANIVSETYYSITAALHNIRLGKGLTLYKAGLEIVAGKTSSIGIVGEVHMKAQLILSAKIFLGTKGLSLQLVLKNCWRRAFNAPWLSICNILGSIDFAPPTAVVGIAFGAEIYLGYRSSGHQIHAKGYFGVNLINPLENYYYVNFNRITMGSLLKAFNIRWRLPRPLAQSGFPHGFLNSFSVLGTELPEVGLSIPAGYRLKGTLNILGLQGSADITIAIPRLIDINVALPPIRIGKVLAMYASSRDQRRGPFLKAKLQLLPRFHIHIEAKGYLKVLLISIEARLKITNSQYEYFIRGKILHLFEASLHLTARYGSIRSASFRVRGEFKLDLFNGIKRIVKNFFSSIANTAKRAYKAASKLVQKFLRLWKRAKQALSRAWRKLWRTRRRVILLQALELCSVDHSCGKALAQGWFRRVVRKVVRSVRRVVRHVHKGIRKGFRVIKKIAKKVYHWARKAYNRVKRHVTRFFRKLKSARKAFEWVKRAFKTGLKIVKYIFKHGLGGIINIRRLWFDVSLDRASLGKFAGGIHLQFFGRYQLKLNISFNLRHIARLAKNLFKKVVRRIKRIFG